jgi:polyisoprenoid-binding protein YceI
MKKYGFVIFLFLSLSFLAQEKYYTKSGEITFESSVPTFEEIKASNTKVTAIIKDNGEIASLTLVKAFQFKIALMEEHFNENYIESDKYPKATFSGKIINFSMNDLSTEEQEFSVKGNLLLHGVEKEISVLSKIKKVDDTIYFISNFSLIPADFAIEIPKIVQTKIAKQIDVFLAFKMTKK